MSSVYPVAEQAAACLTRLNPDHPAFAECDLTSVGDVADRVRASMVVFDPGEPGGISLRIGRKEETPAQLIARCLENTWRVVGREYTLECLDYNISPDPAENTAGCQFGEWTWQLNRHQEWVVAAEHYRETGDSRAVQAICSWLRRWIETCPAPTEALNTELSSWRTIEIGIRLGNTWPKVFSAIKDAAALEDELLLAWLNTVAAQCDFVWPRRKTNNWLMMEMNGLLTAAVMFPFFRDAPTWEANALEVYVREIDNQFLADGMQVELSASYHGVSFVQYLRAAELLRQSGRPVPPEFLAGMQKMLKPWRAMARPDGRVFGFQDSGAVDYGNWLRRLSPEVQCDADAFFLGEGPAPDHRNDLLPNAGQCVLRSGWTLADTAVAIDVGPFGEAHQHEDKLSLQLWARGHDLIGEAGVVDYADSPQRRYSRGTLAHSTAIVDGEGQNSRRTFVKGERPLDAVVDAEYDLESTTPWIRAAYEDGYGAEGEVRVRHERTLMLTGADTVRVTDRFDAGDNGAHTVEVLFHLLTADMEIAGNTCRATGAGPALVLRAHRPDGEALLLSGAKGGTEPDLRGWAQRDPAEDTGRNELVPRPCLTLTAEMVGRVEIVTDITIGD